MIKHLFPNQKIRFIKICFIRNIFGLFKFLPSVFHIDDTQKNENRNNKYKHPSGVHSISPTTTHHATTLTGAHLGTCGNTKNKKTVKPISNLFILFLLSSHPEMTFPDENIQLLAILYVQKPFEKGFLARASCRNRGVSIRKFQFPDGNTLAKFGVTQIFAIPQFS
jgi:hypothetical protein